MYMQFITNNYQRANGHNTWHLTSNLHTSLVDNNNIPTVYLTITIITLYNQLVLIMNQCLGVLQ